MSGLFSHPSITSDTPSERRDLSASVIVPATAAHAWAGLTEHLHLWWPADELSRWGDESFFDLEDNALVETSAEDDENVWGEVVDSRPGMWLELRWRHVGSSSTTAVRLEIAGARDGAAGPSDAEDGATSAGGGIVLALTHSGWTTSDPQDVYDFYQRFWPDALGRYRRFMGGS